ncbi:hypothetical protein H0H93_004029 [Arthromyces matolae]|nr:hypothetical protein H0H93_004029 [Arthromyces matolae]
MEAQSNLKHPRSEDEVLEANANKRLKPVVNEPVAGDAHVEVGDTEMGNNGEAEDIEESKQATKGPKSKDKRARHRSRKDEPKKSGERRRNRRGTRNEETTTTEIDGTPVSDELKAPRLPKRQSALLIGFCGSGYSGMQIQPDAKTIEGVLFQALVRVGAVSKDNADDPVKVGLARAARTDAGVHAAGNLVSIKMITAIPGVEDVVARINQELPPEIRLWAIPGSGLHRALQQNALAQSPDPSSQSKKPLHPFWTDVDLSSHEGELARKRSWRISPEQVERLKAAAKRFEGTHNFHNFTVGRDFGDRSSQRHMKTIEIEDPAVYGDTEWIAVLFHGQSFMLHQIPPQRKMMSALVLSCRTDTPEQIIDELYGPRKVFIPKMPSLGLLLEEPIFDSYNTRMAATVNAKIEPSHPDYRPAITFEPCRELITGFKQKFIYDNMRLVEDRDGLFDLWMRHLDAYSGNDLLYLNPKGVIPQQAVIKKDERRENPFKEKKRFDATSFSVEDDATIVADEDEEEVSINKKDLADTEG